MSFFDEVGPMAVGSRIRALGDEFAAAAAGIYQLYGTPLQPKWFPVFYSLSLGPAQTASGIAEIIGHSHVSVGKILAEMSDAGLILESSDQRDRRLKLLQLSTKGKRIARTIEIQYLDVEAAILQLKAESKNDLWSALKEWEQLLLTKPLLTRVQEAKAEREYGQVTIVPYAPQYRAAFRQLNEQWIKAHFKLEKPDIEVLGNPKKYILDVGGVIFIALLHGKPVGTCALIPQHKKMFELAKMAVDPEVRGRKIGMRLGLAAIEKARSLNAARIYLESNTSLTAAMGLYQRLGFEKVVGAPTPYERCNIQMELQLKS